ncbi:MAG: PD-(D/E)XK nuclease family protein [Oscillospiraceae bacterium]|nr:PD-(D/E)XK nuclease family protein [Oscillospiraceae bacterium]
MFKLILGRAGSGKTRYIFQEIKALSDAGRDHITLIVPEQYSHEAERMLCDFCGDAVNLHGEVLSFSRLCSRVFSQVGGAADRVLDQGGRVLMMRKAMKSVSSALQVFGKNENQTGFVEKLLATLDELKAACITPETITAVFGEDSGPLGRKMMDLALIYSAYEAALSREISDPTDRLTRLAEQIGESSYCREGYVFIDGFRSFTRQQLQVIARLIRSGVDVVVALTCSGLYGEEEMFQEARETAVTLLGIDRGKSSVVTMTGEKPGISGFLEKNLFAYEAAPEKPDLNGVFLFKAESAADECEVAAGRILELVGQGAEFRQIALACCDPAQAELCESTLLKYGIPVYVNRKTNLSATAPVALLASALDVLLSDWEYGSLFRYLKTGLSGMAPDGVDELENYVIQWSIRGNAWRGSEDWTMNPEGYTDSFSEAAAEQLRRVNALRQQAAEPLLFLEGAMDRAKTCGEMLRALYDFMIQIQLPERLAVKRAEKPDSLYDQIWETIVSALEQFDQVMGEQPLSLEEFAQLWNLLLSQYDVGKIPMTLNSVMIGPMTGTLRRGIRHMLVIGASDDALPPPQQSTGILSDHERDEACRLGLELPLTGKGRVYRSISDVYNCLTLPDQTLTMTCVENDSKRPSYIALRVADLFGVDFLSCDVEGARLRAVKPCFELAASGSGGEAVNCARAYFQALPEYAQRLAAVMRASRSDRGTLTRQTAQALYGRRITVSASKADKYYECKYKFFMQYGLRAKPRKTAGFDAPVYGTFIHYLLENVINELKATGGFQGVSPESIAALTAKYVAAYVNDVLLQFAGKNERFIYLFNRLAEDAGQIVWTMIRELADSDFSPVDFELAIGPGTDVVPPELTDGQTQMVIEGFADRVDGWIHGDKLYLRVVDYKTGRKKLSLSNIWYGMGLQMLIYLFALEKSGQAHYERQIVPAGVLYAPAREEMLSMPRGASDEEIEKQRLKSIRRSGLLLDDADVLEAMAHGEGKAYLPVKFGKDGEAAGESLASLEQLGALSRHIDQKLLEIGRELHSGKIELDPFYKSSSDNACQFCDFRQACHFDEENGDRVHRITRLKTPEVWEKITEQEA